eukprot:5870394-Amphidinium_carterae.1
MHTGGSVNLKDPHEVARDICCQLFLILLSFLSSISLVKACESCNTQSCTASWTNCRTSSCLLQICSWFETKDLSYCIVRANS